MEKGIYKQESFNQTIFCFEIIGTNNIRVWREDKKGNVDHWWDMNITPDRAEKLIADYNSAEPSERYSKENIKGTLDTLEKWQLINAIEYFANTRRRKDWA